MKTLKDFPSADGYEADDACDSSFNNYDDDEGSLIYKEVLKESGIKDIVEIKNLKKSATDILWENLTGNNIEFSEEAKIAIINYIKWKFNITEEDLL